MGLRKRIERLERAAGAGLPPGLDGWRTLDLTEEELADLLRTWDVSEEELAAFLADDDEDQDDEQPSGDGGGAKDPRPGHEQGGG